MAKATTAQSAWVLRVLGVGGGNQSDDGLPAAQVWNDAKEAVDAQLNGLYSVLKKTGIPVLNEVATEIESVLGKFRVGLNAALMNYDRAAGPARDKARAEALKVVGDYKARLPADKHVVAADTNPFGVPITIRATLGGALDELTNKLEAA